MDIELEVEANIEALQTVAHERLLVLTASDPDVTTPARAGRDSAADRGLVRGQPSTVNSAVVRAMLEHGLQALEHVVAIGPNTISCKPL